MSLVNRFSCHNGHFTPIYTLSILLILWGSQGDRGPLSFFVSLSLKYAFMLFSYLLSHEKMHPLKSKCIYTYVSWAYIHTQLQLFMYSICVNHIQYWSSSHCFLLVDNLPENSRQDSRVLCCRLVAARHQQGKDTETSLAVNLQLLGDHMRLNCVVMTILTVGQQLQWRSEADGEDRADVHHPETDGLW